MRIFQEKNMDLDREGFYEQLSKCNSVKQLESLIDNIDDEDLHEKMLDKFNQILEFNKSEELKNIIKILEFDYLNFCKKK